MINWGLVMVGVLGEVSDPRLFNYVSPYSASYTYLNIHDFADPTPRYF
jgi:hypothetical protein